MSDQSMNKSSDVHSVLSGESLVIREAKLDSARILYVVNLNADYEFMLYEEISALTNKNLKTVRDWVTKTGFRKVGGNAIFRNEFKLFSEYVNDAKQGKRLPNETGKQQTERLQREWPLVRDGKLKGCNV